MTEQQLFEERVRACKGMITGLVRRFIKNEANVQDVMQQIFMRAWIHRASFEGRSKYSTWIYKLGVRCIINYLNMDKKRVRILDEPPKRFEDIHTVGHYLYSSPDLQLADEEELRCLERAIKTLPPALQEALVLQTVYGWPITQIAKELSIPEGTVKSRLFRAKEALKDKLRD